MPTPRPLIAGLAVAAAAVALVPPVVADGPDRSDEAFRHFQARDWDRAIDAYADVVAANPYDGPHTAARIMRNHHVHHVVVTRDKQVIGMVSAYDLLELVEDHRYVAKNAPTPKNKRAKHR